MRVNARTVIGVVIGGAALGWMGWQLSKDFDALWALLRSSHAGWWAGAVVSATAIFALRAIRWRVILDPVAERLPFGTLWRATTIGMMVNNFIPRGGELVRAYALTRETPRVGLAASFASLAVDRVFDSVVILLLLALGLMQLPGASEQIVANRSIEDWIGTGTIVLVLFIGALYLVVVFPGRMIGLYEMFARRVAPSIEARGRDILLAFASGLSILRSPRRFALVFVWTTLHWLLNAFAFWCGFKAVSIEISPFAALVVQGFVAILVAVPSTPGYAGVFEFASVTALDLYGIDATEALAWALGYHLLTFIPVTVIGLVYFSRLHLHFRDVGRVAASPDPDAALGASVGGGAPPSPGPRRRPGSDARPSDAPPP